MGSPAVSLAWACGEGAAAGGGCWVQTPCVLVGCCLAMKLVLSGDERLPGLGPAAGISSNLPSQSPWAVLLLLSLPQFPLQRAGWQHGDGEMGDWGGGGLSPKLGRERG